MGERTPIWDVHARGVIFGLSLNHTKGHLVRAMMEAVAYALYDSYRLIHEAGTTIRYPIVLQANFHSLARRLVEALRAEKRAAQARVQVLADLLGE